MDTLTHKLCRDCDTEKSPEEFYVSKTGRRAGTLSPYCRSCTKGRAKKYGQTHASERSEYNKARRSTHEGARDARNRDYMRRYGVSVEFVEDLIEAQDGLCASCADELDLGKRTHLDHDHVSGVVRSVLCSHCNLMIGHAMDDPDRLRRAADYLERTSS